MSATTTSAPTTRNRTNGGPERRDTRTEARLDGLAISYEMLTDVSPARFDLDRSLSNQVRFKPVDQHTARRYCELMRAGQRFPPILARLVGTRLIILDGNHRLVAATEAEKTLDVYICSGSEQALLKVAYMANAEHGLPASWDERLEHALHMYETGINAAECCLLMGGLPETTLISAAAKRRADRKATDAEVTPRQWDAIPATMKPVLASGSMTSEGLRAAVELVIDAGLQGPEIRELARHLKLKHSSRAQLEIVAVRREELRQRIAEVATYGAPQKSRRTLGPRQLLLSALSNAETLPVPEQFKDLTDLDREEVRARLDTTIAKYEAIRAVLG